LQHPGGGLPKFKLHPCAAHHPRASERHLEHIGIALVLDCGDTNAEIAANGRVFNTTGGDGTVRTLVQWPGEVNGIAGRFEWIVDTAGNLPHQMFGRGGAINGIPIVR
jgi:hypothetical protein